MCFFVVDNLELFYWIAIAYYCTTFLIWSLYIFLLVLANLLVFWYTAQAQAQTVFAMIQSVTVHVWNFGRMYNCAVLHVSGNMYWTVCQLHEVSQWIKQNCWNPCVVHDVILKQSFCYIMTDIMSSQIVQKLPHCFHILENHDVIICPRAAQITWDKPAPFFSQLFDSLSDFVRLFCTVYAKLEICRGFMQRMMMTRLAMRQWKHGQSDDDYVHLCHVVHFFSEAAETFGACRERTSCHVCIWVFCVLPLIGCRWPIQCSKFDALLAESRSLVSWQAWRRSSGIRWWPTMTGTRSNSGTRGTTRWYTWCRSPMLLPAGVVTSVATKAWIFPPLASWTWPYLRSVWATGADGQLP